MDSPSAPVCFLYFALCRLFARTQYANYGLAKSLPISKPPNFPVAKANCRISASALEFRDMICFYTLDFHDLFPIYTLDFRDLRLHRFIKSGTMSPFLTWRR